MMLASFSCTGSRAQGPSPDPTAPLPMSPIDAASANAPAPSSPPSPEASSPSPTSPLLPSPSPPPSAQYHQQTPSQQADQYQGQYPQHWQTPYPQRYSPQPYPQQYPAQQSPFPAQQWQQQSQYAPQSSDQQSGQRTPLQGGVEHSQTIQPPPQQSAQMPPAQGMQPFPLQTQHWNPYPQGRPGQGQVAPLDRLQKTLLPGWLKQNQMLPQLFGMRGMNAPMHDHPLQGKVEETRPSWLPAWAYSNDSMTAPYHNLFDFGYDRKPMPPNPQWMRLAPSVTRYWKGHVPEPCMVYSVPMPNAPGNFTFESPNPKGPRGWLQFTAKTNAMGFPIYRYWLDQH